MKTSHNIPLTNMTWNLFPCRKERAVYERHKTKSRDNSKNLCICIDGMDQSKTHLPHFLSKEKGTAQLWTLRTHITGALIHHTGPHGKDANIFINTADIPSDTNLTLHVLLASLEQYVKAHNALPETLYLQFDNCWRENKNQFVLAFAFFLVAIGIIKKVST